MSDSEDLKTALLTSARSLLVTEGVAALSIRRVAESAGTTTMTVYSRFGGKEGLLAALFDEGFECLHQAQLQVPLELPAAERLRALCRIYRRVALDYPQHYALMLGPFSGAFTPPPASRLKAMQTLDLLAGAVAAGSPAQDAERSRTQAHQLWAFCHGWVSLEDKGLWGDPVASALAYEAGVEAFLRGAGLL